MNRFLAQTRVTLRRLLRLWAFQRMPKGGTAVRPAVMGLLLGACLGVKGARDYLYAGADATFDEWGLVTFLAYWAVFAVAVMVLGGRRARAPLARAVTDMAGVVLVNSLLLIIMLLCWKMTVRLPMAGSIPAQYIWFAAYWLVGIWSLVTVWRAGNRLWPASVRFRGARLALVAIIPGLLIPRQGLFYGQDTDWTRFDIWYQVREALERDDKLETAVSSAPAIDPEAVLYRQAAMVETAAAALLPPPSQTPQFYFLGLAPSASQTVFKSEVLGAKAVFDTQLGAKGHSLAMINSHETLTRYPLASVSNLDLALARMAKIMRPDKDVLALFVTSHGSAGLISVYLPGFPLNEIRPDTLVQALERSKITNRVIIISACYSGSFIPALKGDNTLVMTAASAETTSFGCSNEREWTYFGDALFNHALKETNSLPQAFAKARELIKTWETAQNLAASDPQISLGKNIEKVLESMSLDVSAGRVNASVD